MMVLVAYHLRTFNTTPVEKLHQVSAEIAASALLQEGVGTQRRGVCEELRAALILAKHGGLAGVGKFCQEECAVRVAADSGETQWR